MLKTQKLNDGADETRTRDLLRDRQDGVFHGFNPTPSFRCPYAVLGRLLSLATPTAWPS